MDRNREYSEWLKFADEDLESAVILCDQVKKPLNVICYHCQQAGEKYLKAFLVSRNIAFEKTHDLTKLVELCQNIESSFLSIVKECMKLNPYSIITRYPSELELIKSDAEAAIVFAKKIKNLVNSFINE